MVSKKSKIIYNELLCFSSRKSKKQIKSSFLEALCLFMSFTTLQYMQTISVEKSLEFELWSVKIQNEYGAFDGKHIFGEKNLAICKVKTICYLFFWGGNYNVELFKMFSFVAQ